MNRVYLLSLVLLSTFLHADAQRREPSLFLEYEREVSHSSTDTGEEELSTFKKVVNKMTPIKPLTPYVVVIPTPSPSSKPALLEKSSIGHDTHPYLVINKPTSPSSRSSSFCIDRTLPSENFTDVPKPKKSLFENISSAKEHILARAKEFLGTPYGFGNKDLAQTDCSGFTQQVFQKFGIALPHSAAEQAALGTYVDATDLQVGDLMFYQTYKNEPSHVAIYAGDGKIIHASFRSKQVQYDAIDKGYYKQRFMYAKRLALNTNSSND